MLVEVPAWAQLAAAVVGPAFTAGAAWAAVKVALNGTTKRVERIEAKVEDVGERVDGVGQRVARIEGQLGARP